MAKKIIAFAITGRYLQAAVIKKKGKGSIEVIDFAQTELGEGADLSIPQTEDLVKLAERVGYRSGSAVFVSPLVQFTDVQLLQKKLEHLKPHQLNESVKWEVEPLVGISGSNAITAANYDVADENDVDLLLMDDAEQEVSVSVSVIESNVFRALKKRFKSAGFSLQRIYPPDVCFYVLTSHNLPGKKTAVLDIGEEFANFIVLEDQKPTSINTYALNAESILDLTMGIPQPELEKAIEHIFTQIPGEEPLVITGFGAQDIRIIEYLDQRSPTGAKGQPVNKAGSLGKSSQSQSSAVFANVIGAAIRELNGGGDIKLGVTDKEILSQRIKKSAYLMPLIGVSFLAVLLLLHYAFMRYQRSNYEDQIVELTARIESSEARKAKYDKLQSALSKLDQNVSLTKKKIRYIQVGSDKGIEQLTSFLNVFNSIPRNIVLSKIEQKQEDRFEVSGTSSDLDSVGKMALGLQHNEWCKSANIVNVTENEYRRISFTVLMQLER